MKEIDILKARADRRRVLREREARRKRLEILDAEIREWRAIGKMEILSREAQRSAEIAAATSAEVLALTHLKHLVEDQFEDTPLKQLQRRELMQV